MARTILVPLDGSEVAEQALPYACRLARQGGAEVVLLRAAPFAANSGKPSSPLRVTVRDAEDYLEALWYRLAGEGLRVRTEVLHTAPARAITFTARREGVDLIIMSTHGYAGVQRFLRDSVAETVLRRTTTPMLFVRASDHPSAPRVDPYSKVLVPLDGTPFAETALTYLQDADWCSAAEIVLLRVVAPTMPAYGADLSGMAGPIGPGPARFDKDQEEEARQYLAQVGERQLEGRVTAAQVRVGLAAQAIVEAASVPDIEFIVLATHGRTGFDRLAHGSVARHVLHHAPVPVLLLHGVDMLAQVHEVS
ncbi:MAG TPA: universal stress protein [Chloroflexota bacterium]